MRTEVLIRQAKDGKWRLRIVSGDTCLLSIPHRTLLDALNTALLLQVHVDNSAELPLRQYPSLDGGGSSSFYEQCWREAEAAMLQENLDNNQEGLVKDEDQTRTI